MTTVAATTPGRRLLSAGWALAFLGIAVYSVQLMAGRFRTPWYLPAMISLAALLAVTALWQRRTWSRYLSFGILTLLAGFSWTFLVMARLPAYSGPVAIDQPFPAFTTARHDGTPFTHRDLLGNQVTVMVFFRGRW